MDYRIGQAAADKLNLKFVPSQARYYIRCPYFLYLSNVKDIYIPYPRLASRKGNFFEGVVHERVSEKSGYRINKARHLTDLIKTEGLYTLNKKVDTEFYTAENVGLRVLMLKPDLILSENTENGFIITILEIKNCDFLMPYHYLQAYVYKLALEKFLRQETDVPVRVAASMICREEGFFREGEHEDDFSVFMERISGVTIDSLVVRDFVDTESESMLQGELRRIATLEANIVECKTCPGAEKCRYS